MPLFRKEAIHHQETRLTGTVLLTQPLSIKLTTFIIVSMTTLVVFFLFTAKYARKETVRGFLVPNKGVIKSFAYQGGIVDKLHVGTNDNVKKGQILATLRIPQSIASRKTLEMRSVENQSAGGELSEALRLQLKRQLALLDEEITQHLQLQQKELVNLNQQASALDSEKQAITQQQDFLDKKLALLKKQQNQFDNLHQQGFLSSLDNQRQTQELLDLQREKYGLARLSLQHSTQQAQIAYKQISIPEQYQLRVNALKRQKADIENQLTQINANFQYTITAPHDGTVTSIQVNQGETAHSTVPLFYIIPEGSELIATLLLPTRSAGFVQNGDDIRIRFDAFPYQRFGFVQGEISSIDQTLITPSDVKLPINMQEPVYRLKAHLNKQQIQAYGQAFNLKSGMLFEADIMLEQRTLIAWLLAPLYSLKGRIS